MITSAYNWVLLFGRYPTQTTKTVEHCSSLRRELTCLLRVGALEIAEETT